MPFPLLGSQRQTEAFLADSSHTAHKNVMRQESARKLYRAGFRAGEEELRTDGRSIAESFAEIVDSKASRIYTCFSNLDRIPEQDEELAQEMLRLAFEWDDAQILGHIRDMEASLKGPVGGSC